MKKIINFLKKFAKKFCFDKKFNSILSCFIEVPILVIGIVTKNTTFMLLGVFCWAIINMILQKVGQRIYLKKHINLNKNDFVDFMKNFIDYGNNKKGDEVKDV